MPVRCLYRRNHSIPAKKLLQTLLTFSLRSILNCSKYCIRSISKHILCRKIQLPDHPPRFITPALIKWLKCSTGTIQLNSCFSWKIKNSMSVTFEKWGRRLIYRCDRLTRLNFTGKFEWPHLSTVPVMVEKPILRSNSLNFFAPIGFSGKVDFFKIALINPFMNRFQKGLLIPRGHVNCEITHHSDINISKFHSRLLCVIGFFRYAPKISLIRPRFFSLFFSSCRWVE